MAGLRRTWLLPIAVMAVGACSSSTEPSAVNFTPSSSIAFGTKGRSVTVHASLVGASGTQAFSWQTSNGAVVAVSYNAADSAVLTSVGSGTATVTASSGGSRGTINVTVTLVVASSLDSGDMQLASPGMPLDFPIVLYLRDSLGNAARGDTVHFTVGGGGSLNVTQAISDLTGRVQATWRLGTSGMQTVTATTGSFSHVFGAEVVPVSTNTTSFNIQVVNVGPAFSPAVQAAFDSAAAFWARAITGDLAADSIGAIPEGNNGCGPGFPAVGPLKVDDVVIMALVDSIDGPGKILGGAGPCIVRVNNASQFAPTLLGAMEFDSADMQSLINAGALSLVIKHEMAHVLGFGTFWPSGSFGGVSGLACLQLPTSSGNTKDTYYNCPQGLAYFDSIGGSSYTGGNKVPVENCATGVPTSCGDGTWNSHWRESVFNNELMTGYLNGGANPVSKMTIAQFIDMGYTGVDVTKAETYTQVFAAPSAFRLVSASIRMGNDARMPLFAKAQGRPPVRVGTTRAWAR